MRTIKFQDSNVKATGSNAVEAVKGAIMAINGHTPATLDVVYVLGQFLDNNGICVYKGTTLELVP